MTAPTPAELIAFVRGWLESPDMPADTTAIYQHNVRMFTALLSRLEGRPHEDDSTRIGQPDGLPAPQHAPTDAKG
jgi:hypothetical protein